MQDVGVHAAIQLSRCCVCDDGNNDCNLYFSKNIDVTKLPIRGQKRASEIRGLLLR